jgi:hypothetical protein
MSTFCALYILQLALSWVSGCFFALDVTTCTEFGIEMRTCGIAVWNGELQWIATTFFVLECVETSEWITSKICVGTGSHANQSYHTRGVSASRKCITSQADLCLPFCTFPSRVVDFLWHYGLVHGHTHVVKLLGPQATCLTRE